MGEVGLACNHFSLDFCLPTATCFSNSESEDLNKSGCLLRLGTANKLGCHPPPPSTFPLLAELALQLLALLLFVGLPPPFFAFFAPGRAFLFPGLLASFELWGQQFWAVQGIYPCPHLNDLYSIACHACIFAPRTSPRRMASSLRGTGPRPSPFWCCAPHPCSLSYCRSILLSCKGSRCGTLCPLNIARPCNRVFGSPFLRT